MAWIYLAESEDSPWRCPDGSDPLPTVKVIDSAMLCFCLGCDSASFGVLPSGTIFGLYDRPCCPDMKVSISSTGDSPARTSALQELEQAWQEADPDSFTNYSALLASASPDSSSWKTYQLSLFEGLTEFSWDSMRWGMMRGGQLSQPRRWEPSIFENDGSYLPTPTACDYGKNVGRKSDGITPSGRDRWSLTVRARRGELPGHPKGSLNPEWIEQAMGYPIGWTAIMDWATVYFRNKEKRDLCG